MRTLKLTIEQRRRLDELRAEQEFRAVMLAEQHHKLVPNRNVMSQTIDDILVAALRSFQPRKPLPRLRKETYTRLRAPLAELCRKG